jgi:PE family
VVAAAGDEVSAAIASLFSGHAQAYRSLSAQAAVFHAQFVRALSGAALLALTAAAPTAAKVAPAVRAGPRARHSWGPAGVVLKPAHSTAKDRTCRNVAERAMLGSVAARAVSTCPRGRPTRTAGKEEGRA